MVREITHHCSAKLILYRENRANIRIPKTAKFKDIVNHGLIIEKAGITLLLDADTIIISVGTSSASSLQLSQILTSSEWGNKVSPGLGGFRYQKIYP